MDTYEEKYKEIVGQIRKAYLYAQTDSTKAVLEEIFPELKESEDERIIKAIKSAVLQLTDIYLQEKYGLKQSDCIAWLEKQGEHANFRNKIQVGDKVTRNEAGVLVNLSQLNRVAKPEENKGNLGGISSNWSENDEEALEMAIIALEDMYDDDTPNTTYGGHYMPFDKAANQLKSLKGRVQPKPMCKFGDTELTNEELCEGLIRGMVDEHNRVTKEVLRTEYEKGRDDVLAKIDAIDVDEMVCESGATSRVTQYWYAHGVNDVIKKLKEEEI